MSATIAASLPGGVELRDYQYDTVSQLLNPPPGVTRDLAVLATGGGKTICFAAVLHHLVRPGRRGLVLAHREELLTQARDKIAMVDPELEVELEQSALRASRDLGLFANVKRNVVVGSVQSLHKKRRLQFDPRAFDVVIVDEAHHAPADSYVDIFDYFGCFDKTSPTRLIGVTATPNRSDGAGLGSIFQRIAAVYDIRELVKRGYLVPPRAIRVNSHTDLSGVKMTAGDFNLGQLETTVNTQDRNELIIAAYRKFAWDRQGIVFATGVDHAHTLSDMFNAAGIPSAAIWGSMSEDARKEALAQFEDGVLQVLLNFGVLTEGYDNPRVSAIVLARPTPSNLLITQMVGRGLRLFDGKDDCLCIDVQDVTSRARCVSVPTLAGLPREFDAQGQDIFAAKSRYETLDPRLAARATNLDDVEELIARAEQGMSVVEVDILADLPADPVVAESSRLMWSAVGDDDYRLTINEATYVVQADILGTWSAVRYGDQRPEVITMDAPDAATAFAIADEFLTQHHDTRLLDRTAPWRRQAASPAQIFYMVNLGLLSSAADAPANLKKGQASQLIEDAKARKRRGEAITPLFLL